MIDPKDLVWRKACGTSACLEVAAEDGTVYLRNSTELVWISASTYEWEGFVDAIRRGDRDAVLRGEIS